MFGRHATVRAGLITFFQHPPFVRACACAQNICFQSPVSSREIFLRNPLEGQLFIRECLAGRHPQTRCPITAATWNATLGVVQAHAPGVVNVWGPPLERPLEWSSAGSVSARFRVTLA